jgi:hypothetical protein
MERFRSERNGRNRIINGVFCCRIEVYHPPPPGFGKA